MNEDTVGGIILSFLAVMVTTILPPMVWMAWNAPNHDGDIVYIPLAGLTLVVAAVVPFMWVMAWKVWRGEL